MKICLHYADFIDRDVLELFEDFKNVVAPERNIQLNIIGLKETYKLKDYVQFINVLDKETQQKLQPAEILDLLKAGNERFTSGKFSDKHYLQQMNVTSDGQNPMAIIVGCIDSRTSPEILFDAGIGDILTVRIAGNVINTDIIGSLEIAVAKLGAKLIVVKGHSKCGAVALSLADVKGENMGAITEKIQKAAVQCGCFPKDPDANEAVVMERVTKKNVTNSMEDILNNSPYLKQRIEAGEVGIVGAGARARNLSRMSSMA